MSLFKIKEDAYKAAIPSKRRRWCLQNEKKSPLKIVILTISLYEITKQGCDFGIGMIFRSLLKKEVASYYDIGDFFT